MSDTLKQELAQAIHAELFGTRWSVDDGEAFTLDVLDAICPIVQDREEQLQLKLAAAEGDWLRAEAERDALKAELPTEMEGQRILFEECVVGHGHLRGENWVKHPCVFCERDALKARIADTVAWAQREFIKPRHDDLDAVAHAWAEELLSRLQKDGGQ